MLNTHQAIFCREGGLAAEIHGGDGAGREIGRSYGKANKESTIVGKLVAINFYHEQFWGLSVPMSNPLIDLPGKVSRGRT